MAGTSPPRAPGKEHQDPPEDAHTEESLEAGAAAAPLCAPPQ